MHFLNKTYWVICLMTFMFLGTGVQAQNLCVGYGPQSPRDIRSKDGINKMSSSLAPKYEKMNLCNIHFHKNAEHKGKYFDIDTNGSGFQCTSSPIAKGEKMNAENKKKVCDNDVMVGDTIEVHWVHTTCNSDIVPNNWPAQCVNPKCKNPQLRVEAQVFRIVDHDNGLNFGNFTFVYEKNGYYQARGLENLPVEHSVTYRGSLTGASFSEQVCSDLQVTWNVRDSCQNLDIDSLGKWCDSNVFEEKKAHSLRGLVRNPALLSPITD